MATIDLSAYKKQELPDAGNMRIGIVVSEWNDEITDNLLKGSLETLRDCGADSQNVKVIYVPGSFELPSGAQLLLETGTYDAVICLGCVVRGETSHFEFVCQTCANGVKDVSLKYNKPVIFGVLTDYHMDQSRARSGGSLGNKGVEAAVSAIKMIGLKQQLEKR